MREFLKLGSRIFSSNFSNLSEPYKLTFAITYQCNSRCKTCGIWKKTPKGELSTKEMERIFEKINPCWVNLTGGEPFLRKDLYKIAGFAKNRGAYLLNLTTNGLLGKKIIKETKRIIELDFPKFMVVVSMDGPKEAHDKIRGVKGNWEKSLDVFRELKSMSGKNFDTFLGYTISSHNIGMIEKTINDSGFEIKDFHFNVFHNSSLYYNNQKQMGAAESKVLEDVNYILKEKKGFDPVSYIEKKYLKLIENYFKTGKSPMPCNALNSSCFIEPDGEVYPCTSYEIKLGNLRNFDYNLKTIWNSKKAIKTRIMINKNKCGGCWTPCEAYQTILGNILKI